jgi:hypothetical protein
LSKKTELKPVRLNRFRFFSKKFDLIIVFNKNQIKQKIITVKKYLLGKKFGKVKNAETINETGTLVGQIINLRFSLGWQPHHFCIMSVKCGLVTVSCIHWPKFINPKKVSVTILFFDFFPDDKDSLPPMIFVGYVM